MRNQAKRTPGCSSESECVGKARAAGKPDESHAARRSVCNTHKCPSPHFSPQTSGKQALRLASAIQNHQKKEQIQGQENALLRFMH